MVVGDTVELRPGCSSWQCAGVQFLSQLAESCVPAPFAWNVALWRCNGSLALVFNAGTTVFLIP